MPRDVMTQKSWYKWSSVRHLKYWSKGWKTITIRIDRSRERRSIKKWMPVKFHRFLIYHRPVYFFPSKMFSNFWTRTCDSQSQTFFFQPDRFFSGLGNVTSFPKTSQVSSNVRGVVFDELSDDCSCEDPRRNKVKRRSRNRRKSKSRSRRVQA